MDSGRKEIKQGQLERRRSEGGMDKGGLDRTDCRMEMLGFVLGLLEREQNLTV